MSGAALAQGDGSAVAEADEDANGSDAADFFARDEFRTETIVCPFKGAVSYKPGEVACGLLAVPENREKSRARTIKLHYVKIAAKKPKDWDAEKKGAWSKREDPIIYLTGGPGAQVTGYVKRLKDHGVLDARDLYILEQRGIGYSGDFCEKYGLFDPSAGNTADWDAYGRAQIAQMEACFAGAKAERIDLSGYNTIENARDVEALRRALGFEQWNVWGISYGSILGQAYINQDPAGIRAIVLDAIVPITPGAHFQRIGTHYQRDLDLLDAACAADPPCARAFPDLQKRFKAAINKVKSTPIEVEAIDSERFPSGKAWFFHDLIGGVPFSSLYEQDTYPTLPALMDAVIRRVEKNDTKALRALTAGGAFGGPGGFGISQGMYNAIACNDGWVLYLQAAVAQDQREHPELASIFGDPALIEEQAALCKRYGMPPRPQEQFKTVSTTIPAIIANGQMDPITPPPLAQMIVRGFSRGTYVEFPYSGHGPTRSVKCAGEFLTKFFDAPESAVDKTCPESIKAPKFAGKFYKTDGLLNLAAKAAEDPKKLAAPALTLGGSILILLIAFSVYTLAPLARLINRDVPAPTFGARPLAWATALLGLIAAGGLGAAVAMTFQANEINLLGGLLGWARWFAVAGLLAGLCGLGVLGLGIRARLQRDLPVGTLLGLILTGAAGTSLAAALLMNGIGPL
ncbi:MAG: alpha/beta fold hydrolase [Parvularculaceae bacterium]|nr:alpha/beta fold hydrolase [Parvularculaceae bacterium]